MPLASLSPLFYVSVASINEHLEVAVRDSEGIPKDEPPGGAIDLTPKAASAAASGEALDGV